MSSTANNYYILEATSTQGCSSVVEFYHPYQYDAYLESLEWFKQYNENAVKAGAKAGKSKKEISLYKVSKESFREQDVAIQEDGGFIPIKYLRN